MYLRLELLKMGDPRVVVVQSGGGSIRMDTGSFSVQASCTVSLAGGLRKLLLGSSLCMLRSVAELYYRWKMDGCTHNLRNSGLALI